MRTAPVVVVAACQSALLTVATTICERECSPLITLLPVLLLSEKKNLSPSTKRLKHKLPDEQLVSNFKGRWID